MEAALKWGLILALAGISTVTCKLITSDDGSANTIASAKFESGEISGWNADENLFPKGFVRFTTSDMVSLVNGGAAEYVAKGMSEGFRQDLKKGEQTYQSWVMDFGTKANAEDMYNTKVQQYSSDKETAGSYPETKSFVKSSMYGYDGYAIFGKYLVVIWLDGFGANKSEAKNMAVEFLETIEQKITELKLLS